MKNIDKNNMAMIDFDDPGDTNKLSIIKVIGVGGGGGNAVNHMFRNGIRDVSFLLCNTDSQALNESPVPVRLQLGKEGLGAGNNPSKGREAAEESLDDIKRMLDDGTTRMTFITAGMGGGTGTGAAPVIARVSRELNLLTVGIVTIPFRFEGVPKIDQALDGVEELSKHVDALLVINNERLREIYSDLTVLDAFAKADDTLNVAAKSIAEIITDHKRINLDFNDVKTVLKDGGVAIMSTGYGEGEGRVRKAIENALNSPLLSDNDIFSSKKILLSINFSNQGNQGGSLMMDEMNDVNDFMAKFNSRFEIKWGLGVDDTLGGKVKVTILATGFGLADVDGMGAHMEKKEVIEDPDKRAELEEIEAAKAALRTHYYGQTGNGAHYKRRPNLFLFRNEDLDNDDVIYAVESLPTAKRTAKHLKDIRTQANGGKTPEAKDETPVSAGESRVISFT